MNEEDPPSAAQVESMWRDLVRGVVSRQEVHAWAAPWVEDRWAELDPHVENAMQSLHGFDLTYDSDRPSIIRHGPGGAYVHTDAHVADSLERWLALDHRPQKPDRA